MIERPALGATRANRQRHIVTRTPRTHPNPTISTMRLTANTTGPKWREHLLCMSGLRGHDAVLVTHQRRCRPVRGLRKRHSRRYRHRCCWYRHRCERRGDDRDGWRRRRRSRGLLLLLLLLLVLVLLSSSD